MDEFINQFLFGYYPYIVMVTIIVASILRYKFNQYSWKSSSSQLIQPKGIRVGSNLFHIGIIVILIGHLVGLLTPEWLYHQFITPKTKQIMAMLIGGVFGVICFIGITILLKRRLFDPRVRINSRVGDILILILLYIQLILGLLSIFVSYQHIEGESMIALANWAQYIVTFRSGAADFVFHEHIIFKLHLVLGMTIFLLLPFTRLVHILSMPAGYLTRVGYQIVRKKY